MHACLFVFTATDGSPEEILQWFLFIFCSRGIVFCLSIPLSTEMRVSCVSLHVVPWEALFLFLYEHLP